MMSPLLLERPGRWRIAGVVLIALTVTLPAWPLVASSALEFGRFSLSSFFSSAAFNSLGMGALVAALAFAVGWPMGVLTALYAFRGRRPMFALAALPLLVPSFLWAIGWSTLAARLGPYATGVFVGRWACIHVFLASAIPFVLLATYAACETLTASQIDAARLAGGEKAAYRCACRYTAVAAFAAALLAGVLTLSDPGPGMIFGVRTSASEILTSFSAQYDFEQGAGQCLLLAGMVFLATLPLAAFLSPTLAHQVLARQSQRLAPQTHRTIGTAVIAVYSIVGLLFVLVPTVGLVLPILNRFQFGAAGDVLIRTALNTALYAGGAGAVAALLGVTAAFFAGRSDRMRTALLATCLILFALPPSLFALGVIRAAAAAPPWADWLVRSRLTVCLDLGLRLFPIAAVLAFRAWGSIPASWSMAAAVHGVPLSKYLSQVVLPHMAPAIGVMVVLVGLLATADVSTVLLLHPPGEGTLPLAIFTIMANAPESLVASLCVAYLAASGVTLFVVWSLAGALRS